MKVKELIEELEKLDPNAEVISGSTYGYNFIINSIEKDDITSYKQGEVCAFCDGYSWTTAVDPKDGKCTEPVVFINV